MSVAASVCHWLKQQTFPYQVIHHARSADMVEAALMADISPQMCASATMVEDDQGALMIVHRASEKVDVETLSQQLNRPLAFTRKSEAIRFFPDAEIVPAFAIPYGIECVVDDSLFSESTLYLAAGGQCAFIEVNRSAFDDIFEGAVRLQKIECNAEELLEAHDSLSLERMIETLEGACHLPPMPTAAVRLLHVINDPDSTLDQLADLVSKDPSVSAQIMRHANSCLFNFKGEIKSPKDAINKVLGFDRVAQMAMGLCALKPFRIPQDGILGLDSIWQHAVWSAELCQRLSRQAGIDPQEAYTTGLLHNFGLLLIGHLFPHEFSMLNKLRQSRPDESMACIEKQVFGMGQAQTILTMGHGLVGATLLRLWRLPEYAVKAAAFHQSPDYVGDFEEHVKLLRVANYALATRGVGDELAETMAMCIDGMDDWMDASEEAMDAMGLVDLNHQAIAV